MSRRNGDYGFFCDMSGELAVGGGGRCGAMSSRGAGGTGARLGSPEWRRAAGRAPYADRKGSLRRGFRPQLVRSPRRSAVAGSGAEWRKIAAWSLPGLKRCAANGSLRPRADQSMSRLRRFDQRGGQEPAVQCLWTMHFQGFTTVSPAASKGPMSRVAMMNPLEEAMAAIYPSGVGNPLPAVLAFTAKAA